MDNVEFHKHTGVDSPQILESDIEKSVNYNNVVLLTTDQTIAGVKTFSSIPVLPSSNPTTDNQAARKAYVDSQIGTTKIVASDYVRDSSDGLSFSAPASYTKKKEIQYNEKNGTIRVYFTYNMDGTPATGYFRVYKNGVAAGTEKSTTSSTPATWSEDFSVATGDLIQVYYYRSSGAYNCNLTNFRLCYDKIFDVTAGTVNLD